MHGFFFKQKTAYEMRISDWSSDVCSSDLAAAAARTGVPISKLKTAAGAVILPDGRKIPYVELAAEAAKIKPVQKVTLRDPSQWRLVGKPMNRLDMEPKIKGDLKFGIDQSLPGMRSEEHTSELQSLMRISYAVFC